MSIDQAVDYALNPSQPARTRNRPAHPSNAQRLTDREREVAVLVKEGLTDKEIAARLIITPRTAQGPVGKILRKLDMTSRAQIAAWATCLPSPEVTSR